MAATVHRFAVEQAPRRNRCYDKPRQSPVRTTCPVRPFPCDCIASDSAAGIAGADCFDAMQAEEVIVATRRAWARLTAQQGRGCAQTWFKPHAVAGF